MRWVALAMVCLQGAAAQTIPTIRSETRVVQVDVVAKDSHGRVVEDLTKADFTLKDNGKPRAIDIFSINRGEAGSEAPPPLPALPPNVFSNRLASPGTAAIHATVILLDTFNDYFDNYARSRDQVIRMIEGLRPDERVAVYVLSQYKGLLILQDYTTDHALLIRNLTAYLPSGMVPAPVPGGRELTLKDPPSLREFDMRNGAESIRTAMTAIADHLAIMPGRKTLLWVSQGFPPRMVREMPDAWAKAIDHMNQANVELDAIDSNGLMGPPRRWGRGTVDTMKELAERTGGKAYYNRNDLDRAMAEAVEEKRTSYTLAFYLGSDEDDGKFHRLTVQTARPHLDLHYRQGYIAGTDRKMEQSRKKEELESALLSPLDATGVGITMKVEAVPGKPRGTLRIRTNLDASTIVLAAEAGRWTGKFDEMFVEENADGKTIGRISLSRRFQLNAEQHQRFEREGLTYSETVPCENGTVKVHVIIRDSETGHVGSLTIPLVAH